VPTTGVAGLVLAVDEVAAGAADEVVAGAVGEVVAGALGEVVAGAADAVVSGALDEVVAGAGELAAVVSVPDDELVDDVGVGFAATVVVAAVEGAADETALLLVVFAETVVAVEPPLDDPDGPQPVSNAAPAALPNSEMICRRCIDEFGLDNIARSVCLYFIGKRPSTC
jgi:hypothetical protein